MAMEISTAKPRPLPVILLADISGSMSEDGKIDALNDAVNEMIRSFAEEEDNARTEIQVAVITFGGEGGKLHKPLQSASDIQWEPMAARGRTPLGAAINLATDMLEDREQIPSRAYRAALILVSDGLPNDEWRGPLERLLNSERGSKADRFAMAIGDDADHNMLIEFLASPEAQVFQAHEARQIRNFFQWVTMTIATRSFSINPNSVVKVDPDEIDDYEF